MSAPIVDRARRSLVLTPGWAAQWTRPGMRVLEIGGGTGYNAALIHAITGAEVTTLEAGHPACPG